MPDFPIGYLENKQDAGRMETGSLNRAAGSLPWLTQMREDRVLSCSAGVFVSRRGGSSASVSRNVFSPPPMSACFVQPFRRPASARGLFPTPFRSGHDFAVVVADLTQGPRRPHAGIAPGGVARWFYPSGLTDMSTGRNPLPPDPSAREIRPSLVPFCSRRHEVLSK